MDYSNHTDPKHIIEDVLTELKHNGFQLSTGTTSVDNGFLYSIDKDIINHLSYIFCMYKIKDHHALAVHLLYCYKEL